MIGRWRIVAMEAWSRDTIDLVGPAFIEFDPGEVGRFGFIAVVGRLDWRTTNRDGRDVVDFSWVGADEGDSVSGRGWAASVDDGSIEGRFFFHMGDDSGFRAERMANRQDAR